MNRYYVVFSVNNKLNSDIFATNEVIADVLLEWQEALMLEYKTTDVTIVNWKRID